MTSLKKAVLVTAGLALSWLALAGTASAASSPTVTLTAPTGVVASGATLNADIASHGVKTTYHFSYGPTSALGDNGPVKSVDSQKTSAVSYTLGGLQSGTTYYYGITATSAAGTTTTQVKSFKTAGPPPPGATTGPALITSPTSVTLTGSVAPNDAVTTYYFEYGTTTSYGSESAPITVPASNTEQSVSVVLPPLGAGTTFYYNLVASHGGTNTAAGTGGTFYTPPTTPPKPPVGASTTPSGETGHGPFSFTTKGHISNHSPAPAVDACYGNVTIAFDHDGKRVYATTVPLNADCTFSATETLSHLPVALPHGVKSEHLVVYARFNGNYYEAVHQANAQTITLS